ncbi:TPA: DUF6402 family protein [Photobacterium damselae]
MSANVESRGLIHLGDKTTTGGVVVQGIGNVALVGSGVTQVGMLTTCPACKVGQGKIVPLTTINVFADSIQAALHGDIVACGCPYGANTVIASAGSMSFSVKDGIVTGNKPFSSPEEASAAYSDVAAMAGARYELDEALVDGFRKFTVRNIPDVMKNKLNWPKSAELMELWFSKPAKIMTDREKEGKDSYDKDYTDKNMFSLNWLMGFERTRRAKTELISQKRLWSDNAQKAVKNKVAKIIAEKGYIEINNSSLDIVSLHRDWQFQYVTVGYDIGVMDDLYGSLGNFGLYAAINKAHVEEIEGETFLIVTEISVYMRDTFEFIGEQYLGHWNEDGMGINLAGGALNKANFEWSLSGWNPTLGIVEAFGNSDFRDYRTSKGKGGDLLLFSDRGAVTVYEKIKMS